jgi:hypothetical protein
MSREECEEIDVIGFQLGLPEGDARDRIEAHLCGCATCVRTFLAFKRAMETPDAGPRPSELARARLRRAVAAELHPPAARRWWEPALAFAVAASVVLVAGATTRALTSGPGTAPYAVRR